MHKTKDSATRTQLKIKLVFAAKHAALGSTGKD
jgi:hypothetical protein